MWNSKESAEDGTDWRIMAEGGGDPPTHTLCALASLCSTGVFKVSRVAFAVNLRQKVKMWDCVFTENPKGFVTLLRYET